MKKQIARLISKEADLPEKDIETLLEVPGDTSLGDFAFPCFSLAKKLKKSPIVIAEDLSKKFKGRKIKGISLVESRKGYLNFFLDRRIFARLVFENVFSKNFGKNEEGEDEQILIEFSQPNTHKAFHVGHIRGTCLGESLARIFESSGLKVVRANYSGDTGMHIAKWIWCYLKYHKKEKISDDESWIAGIYVDAVKRLEKNKKLQKEVDEINLKIESKEDKEINKLWRETRKRSIASWNVIYKQLGTKFDIHYFESDFEEKGKAIAEELLKRKIAKKDDAIFMDLQKEGLGVWVLLRKDGTVLYSAKDLALAHEKLNTFHFKRYLITVGDEQTMHFKQLVKTLELMKFPRSSHYDFLPFGMVRFPEGKMSSRTGNNVLYSQFYEEVFEVAQKGLIARGVSQKEASKRASTIAIAAIKYAMLKQDPRKIMIFNPKEAISFEGDTGPYLLYSYARAHSILKNVKKFSKKTKKNVLKKDEIGVEWVGDVEHELLKKLNLFPFIVSQAYNRLSPNLIANYSFELAQAFNEFYHSEHILGSSDQAFRLKVVEAFTITLKKSLDLLGIDVLEEM